MPSVTNKDVNYTDVMTAELVEAYSSAGKDTTAEAHTARAAVVKEFASKFKKNERSIRAKLVTQKVYIKRAEKSKVTGETPEKKEVLAERLSKATPFQISADSIEKMNKVDIQAFLTFFNDQIVEDSGTEDSDTEDS